MAVQDGVAVLKFGTTTITGYIVGGIRESNSGDDMEIPDEDGDIVTHINNYGLKTEVSFDMIPKSGITVPVIGDTLAYTSGVDGSESVTVTAVESQENNRDVLKLTITGKRYPLITLA